jgi:hypothetical protein
MVKFRTYHKRFKSVDGFAPRQHPSYTTWAGMLSRCYDKAQPNYTNYGGRGITVCESWHHFINFVHDMGVKPTSHSLDRINNDGNYELSNCRWATRTQQNSNKRIYKTNTTGASGVRLRGDKYQVRITIDGKRKSIGNYNTVEEALTAKAQAIASATCRT